MLQLSGIAMVGWFLSPVLAWFLSHPYLPYVTGAAILIIGGIRLGKELPSAAGVDKLTVLAPVLLAIPMAVFGTDHFVFWSFVVRLVPKWIPGHLFWTLFVGTCLIAGALSLAVNKYATLAAALFGIMLFLFVVLMHIPSLLKLPTDRVIWAVAFRDLTFGAGALCFAAQRAPERWRRPANVFLTLARVEMGVALVFFAILHFRYPDFLPGIPMEDRTPAWVPLHVAVAYLTGVALLIAAVGFFWSKKTSVAATGLGILLLLLAIFFYVPIMIAKPSDISIGLNYLADTLMFSACALFVAEAYRGGERHPSRNTLASTMKAQDETVFAGSGGNTAI